MTRASCMVGLLLGILATRAGADAPKPIETPAPRYPSWAIGTGMSTEVELRALIGKDGAVRRVEVVPYDVGRDLMTRDMRASFDSAAVRAVQAWRFRPATQKGRAISAWWTIHVPFSDPEQGAADTTAWFADTTDTSRSPEPLERAAPEWPAAVPYGCRGSVRVRIVLGPEGRPWAANVAASALSCRDPSLREAAHRAALRAARHWRYRAGEHEGESLLIEFAVPPPRLDAPVVVGCVRDSLNGRLRPGAEIHGRDDHHSFGLADDDGWFVLRGAAASETRLRALLDACHAGGFRTVRPWRGPGDELTLYTRRTRCRESR